jgi:hypothetical protein
MRFCTIGLSLSLTPATTLGYAKSCYHTFLLGSCWAVLGLFYLIAVFGLILTHDTLTRVLSSLLRGSAVSGS